MKRLALLSMLAAVCVLALAGCGGHHHQSAGGSVHPPGWGRPIPGLLPHLTTAVPTAEQFDTITLPALAGLRPRALAGYTAGAWPTYLPLRRAYPHAVVKSIAISASYHADCLDVEPDDATPAQAPGWVRADVRARFGRPCVYSSLWEFVNQVRPALAAAGISRRSVWEWDADYTGRPGIDPGFDATQWTDHAYGRNLDESTGTLAFLGIAPQPAPNVNPHPRPRPRPRPRPDARTSELYGRYDNTPRRFRVRYTYSRRTHLVAARERSTVEAYDRARCVQPARRTVCKTSTAHLRLLRGRLLALHRHHPWGYGKPASIGARNQEIYHRTVARRPIRSWAGGM